MTKRSGAANHLHRYKLANLSRDSGKKPYYVFKCMKPACTHYIPVHLAEGKLCECYHCSETMMIGKNQLNGSGGGPMTFVHCPNCIKRKKPDDVKAVQDFLSNTDIANRTTSSIDSETSEKE